MSLLYSLQKVAALSAASGVFLGGGMAAYVASRLWEGSMKDALVDGEGRSYPNLVAVDSVLRAVGHTPVVRLKSLSELTGCDVYAKLEGMNPTGSMADRTASIVMDHVVKAELHPGSTTSLVTATESKDLARSLGAMANACGRTLSVHMPLHMFDSGPDDRHGDVLGALGVGLDRVQATAPSLSEKKLLADPTARIDTHAQVMNDCLRHAEQSQVVGKSQRRLFLRHQRLEWARAEGAAKVADEARGQLRALGVRRLWAVAAPSSGALGAPEAARSLSQKNVGALGEKLSPSLVDVCLAHAALPRGRRLSFADAAAVGACGDEIDRQIKGLPGPQETDEHDVGVTPAEAVRMASYLALREGILVGPAGALAACAGLRAAAIAKRRKGAEHALAESQPGSSVWEAEGWVADEKPVVLIIVPDGGRRHLVHGLHDAAWCTKALGVDLDAMRKDIQQGQTTLGHLTADTKHS